MTGPTSTNNTSRGVFAATFLTIERLGNFIPDAVLGLALRCSVAYVFWNSGRNKVVGLTITDSTLALFRDEFKLPLVPPDIAAYVATTAEHVFPLLLFAGLFARLGAAALLFMTLVIQVFVYPDAWPTHALWASCLLYVIARGPGAVSLDRLILNRRPKYLKSATTGRDQPTRERPMLD